MKKLMIAACAICAAVAVNAAQFTWKTDYAYVVDHEGNEVKTSTAYSTLMGSSGEKVGNIVLVLLDKEALYSDVSKMTVLKGISGDTAAFKTSGSTSLKYGTSSTYKFAAGDGSPLKDGDKVGVMYQSADGALSQLVYWDKENNKAGDAIESIYTVSGMADADPPDTWSGSTFIYAQGASDAKVYFTTSVPEPTSGLLLLLGVGAMALRRRRA